MGAILFGRFLISETLYWIVLTTAVTIANPGQMKHLRSWVPLLISSFHGFPLASFGVRGVGEFDETPLNMQLFASSRADLS